MNERAAQEGLPVRELAATVRRRRERLGLRQEEVADLAGCSERFVHTLENAKPTVRLDKVLAVLKVLGLGLVIGSGSGEIRGPDADDVAGTP